MLKNSILLLVLLFAASCATEVKPILKPTQSDIPTRIANHQKWIDQGIASRELTRDSAAPIQDDLDSIRRKYERLQAQGALSVKDADAVSRMLNRNSQMIFDATQKRRKSKPLGEQY